MSIPYELDEITKTSIEELVEFSVREGETLAFKAGPPNTWRQIPSDKPEIIREKKAEFLKDVSAFANLLQHPSIGPASPRESPAVR